MTDHYPAVAPSTQTGIWNVYCAGCSDKIDNYVFPCEVGVSLFPPSGQLIDPIALRAEIVGIINEMET